MRKFFYTVPILWGIIILVFFLLFVEKIGIEDYVVPPPSIHLDDWIGRFISVGIVELAISFLLGFFWIFLSGRLFTFTLASLSKPWHCLWWAGFLGSCFIISFVYTWIALGVPSEGVLYVYIFLVGFVSLLSYYLFTLVYSPQGVKFIPWGASKIRKNRW